MEFTAKLAKFCACAALCLSLRGNAAALDAASEGFGTSGPLTMPRTELPCGGTAPSNQNDPCLPVIPQGGASEAIREAHLRRAIIYTRFFQMDLATQNIGHALKASAPSIATLHLGARTLLTNFPDRRRLEEASVYIQKAIKIAPSDPALLATQAYTEAVLGKSQIARRLFDRVLKTDPKNIFVLSHLAERDAMRENFSLAKKRYDTLVNLEPDNIDWYRARGEILLRLEMFKESIADFSRVIGNGRPDPIVYLLRARALEQVGSYEECIKDLSALIDGPGGGMRFALGPDELANFMMSRAMVQLKLGRTEDAATDLLNGVELGGTQQILRFQIFLTELGLKVAVDGQKSEQLRDSVLSCLSSVTCAKDFSNRQTTATRTAH
jgi:predicted Zn-dependent protease